MIREATSSVIKDIFAESEVEVLIETENKNEEPKADSAVSTQQTGTEESSVKEENISENKEEKATEKKDEKKSHKNKKSK